MLLNRQYILENLKVGNRIISVHEHIGSETLFFSENLYYNYSQTLDGLFEKFESILSNKKICTFASVVTTMPYYINYKLDKSSFNLFGKLNSELIDLCYNWAIDFPNKIPIPFITLDLNTSIDDIDSFINKSVYPVMGFKLHPPARNFTIESLVNSNLLNFLAEVNLPILLHCSRIGTEGDFDDIYKKLLLNCVDKNIVICIAHAGFLSKNIRLLKDFKNIYIDVSPWSVIMDSVYGNYDFDFCVNRLVELIEQFPNKILYGGDSPFDIQIWSDNSKHGKGNKFDSSVLFTAIKKIDNALVHEILHSNPLNYLSCKSCKK